MCPLGGRTVGCAGGRCEALPGMIVGGLLAKPVEHLFSIDCFDDSSRDLCRPRGTPSPPNDAGSRVIPRILESVARWKPADQTGHHPPDSQRPETAEDSVDSWKPAGRTDTKARRQSERRSDCPLAARVPPPHPPCSPAYTRGGTGWRTQTFAMKACKPKRRPENTWKPAAPIKECKSNTSRTLSGNLPRRYCTAPRDLQLQPARRTARTRRAPHRRNASRSKTTTRSTKRYQAASGTLSGSDRDLAYRGGTILPRSGSHTCTGLLTTAERVALETRTTESIHGKPRTHSQPPIAAPAAGPQPKRGNREVSSRLASATASGAAFCDLAGRRCRSFSLRFGLGGGFRLSARLCLRQRLENAAQLCDLGKDGTAGAVFVGRERVSVQRLQQPRELRRDHEWNDPRSTALRQHN